MGDTQEDQQQSQELSPGDLRRLLEEEKQRSAQLANQVQGFEQDRQLRDAGLGHLTDRQRRTILRELAEDNQEFSGESAMVIAQELGFSTTPPTAPKSEGSTSQNGQEGQGQQQQEETEDALSVLGQMQQARQAASTNQVSPDFTKEMSQAKSKEELRDLIRTKGPRHGVIHEWDVP